MEKDHVLKDKILEALSKYQSGKFTAKQFMAKYLNISIERARKLLEEITQDSYCSRKNGYGDFEYIYLPNDDTIPFHKSGGYTRLARIEYWKNFPKHKWYLLDPVKFIGGAIVGALITILIQQIQTPKANSIDSTVKEQKNINNVGKGNTLALPKDSSIKTLDTTGK
jgi:hypothetical protein